MVAPAAATIKGGETHAAQQPEPYSITSSARTRNDSGIVTPIASAILSLIAISSFVGSSTGISAGFSPLTILFTYLAARR